ncbi:MAG TPA: DUF4350 domain-containing protein [Caulobacterales bacterium]|nr:DUF4350 domain-containing protein [Caulobacterales bacterium]
MSVLAAPAQPPRAQLFSMKVVLALLLVGVFSFSAFLTLSTFAPDLTSGEDGRAHALSRSSIGFAAAVELARLRGAPVTVSRTPLSDVHRTGLFILSPEEPLSAEAIAPLATDRVLVILPKWGALPKPDHRGWVLRAEAAPTEFVAAVVASLAPKSTIARAPNTAAQTVRFAPKAMIGPEGQAIVSGPIANLQTIAGPGLEPVIVTEDGRMVMARIGHQPIYILADPDFLNTQGLANIDTARVGMTMLDSLRDAGEPIIFDVTLNGFARDRSILRLAFEPPFLAATLSLLAVGMLLAWRSITRAGPQMREQRAIALGKKTLAENSAALIRLARREHRMGKGYAALTKDAVVDLLGLARTDNADIDATLDRIGAAQHVSSSYTELAKDAAAAQTPTQMLAAARRLNLWKEEMLRATR